MMRVSFAALIFFIWGFLNLSYLQFAGLEVCKVCAGQIVIGNFRSRSQGKTRFGSPKCTY